MGTEHRCRLTYADTTPWARPLQLRVAMYRRDRETGSNRHQIIGELTARGWAARTAKSCLLLPQQVDSITSGDIDPAAASEKSSQMGVELSSGTHDRTPRPGKPSWPGRIFKASPGADFAMLIKMSFWALRGRNLATQEHSLTPCQNAT